MDIYIILLLAVGIFVEISLVALVLISRRSLRRDEALYQNRIAELKEEIALLVSDSGR